ncbi:hypothetical protein GE21DRAFT_8369 [Neurospora crassa]|uniref:UBX domain-containing protein n=2 Tax=Neurospora crassa TaxID=5141 RepID=V5INH4_NEUCR|nr:UBX domain-containing protein, variant [Neurospora crassa OR74A]XP_011394760.1 UBX domain-containing protein [Neurospora crassa OR74A]KHE78442.1 hypothetical protein GE21DRAFT_8369 [Neurospora crassa]ESA42709.1 UBX domain-containing protein [Neurospora crassa OR74A]ESA42710.1 UBX domain-containing protein, variant [Neurospora crassa OR74A]CAD71014.1 conserved hypothetical protein [Neurospora crassa]|eukprot:XP_011394759.1 UBX domain-containing protein, variant [Neurospora crassa OR74A]
MGQTDLEVLIDMGFERARAELAVKKSGGLQGALTWLEENQDKSLEELQASAASAATAKADDDEEDDGSPIPEGAKSLVCNDCGKRFKNGDLAAFHASKTQHTDFSESTEEIAPLTEEEKKQRLEELRQKLAEKRERQALVDKEEQKRNEQIKRKATKESQDMKEELARKEQMKEAARKRQEKLDDIEAKKRIKAKIEADKAERRRKEEEAKALREGRAPAAPSTAPAAAAAAPAASKPAASHNEARLRLQTAKGNVMKTLAADATLFELAQQLESENGVPVASFSTTFPRKTWQAGVDFGQTLKEAGLVPSAVLIVN